MKKILVTGGNKGIGLAIVKLLLRDFPDTFLLLGSRDVSRGEAAVKQLVTELGKERQKIFVDNSTYTSSLLRSYRARRAAP